MATWDAMEGAIDYHCVFVNRWGQICESFYVEEPTVQMQDGYSLIVEGMTVGGENLGAISSEMYGTANRQKPETLSVPKGIFVNRRYTVRWSDLLQYEVLANIKSDSVRTEADGSLYFEITGPHGDTMRFVGTGVTYENGQMVFAPGGQIVALDAIGRICAMDAVIVDGEENDYFLFLNAYTFTDATSVASVDELYVMARSAGWPVFLWKVEDHEPLEDIDFHPNFVTAQAAVVNQRAITVSELVVYYDETTFNTGVKECVVKPYSYGFGFMPYLEGEAYDPSREGYDEELGIYDFYLLIRPDVADARTYVEYAADSMEMFTYSLVGLQKGITSVGDLKDADGNVLDKNNAVMALGTTIEVTVGKYVAELDVPVVERFMNAQNLHEMTPFANASAKGEVTALVIPIYWQDQQQNATEELISSIQQKLGRIVEGNGVVTDYSNELVNEFSLSGYYDISSYGQYQLTSFVTDWYAAPYNYENEKEFYPTGDDEEFLSRIYEWLMETYPDMDWTKFDANEDGFFDAVIMINAGTTTLNYVQMGTYGYAQFHTKGYTAETAGTQEQPTIMNFAAINIAFLNSRTIIHEYAHGFGLVDYYDVNYSGADAVGGFDMQSQNVGD